MLHLGALHASGPAHVVLTVFSGTRRVGTRRLDLAAGTTPALALIAGVPIRR